MNTVPNPTSADASQDEYILSVKDLLAALWRRRLLILLTSVALAVLIGAYGFVRGASDTLTYEATLRMLIGREQVEQAAQENPGSDTAEINTLTSTMTQAISTRPVAQDVVERLGLQEEMTAAELLDDIKVERAGDTRLIKVTYQGDDPEETEQITNAVGTAFSERVSEISPNVEGVTATIWEEAVVPEEPVSSPGSWLRNGILGLALGAMLGAGLAILLELLNDRWRSPEEAERVLGVPTFGVVPEFEPARGAKTKKGEG